MAIFLALRDKVTDEFIADRGLIAVDEAICAYHGVEPDEVEFFADWVDTIGFSLAMGKTFAEAKAKWLPHDDRLGDIADWLEANYINDSYRNR